MDTWNWLWLALATALLSACHPIAGSIQLTKSLQVEITIEEELEGFPGDDPGMPEEVIVRKERKTIPAGNYQASLSFPSKEKLILNIKDPQTKNKIVFDIPDTVSLPSYSGRIEIPNSQTGQIYTIHGWMDTEEWNSSTIYTTESCSYTRKLKLCGEGRRGDRARRRRSDGEQCQWKRKLIRGVQEVEYHYHYQKRDVELEMVENAEPVASFTGSRTDRNKVYTFKGRCY